MLKVSMTRSPPNFSQSVKSRKAAVAALPLCIQLKLLDTAPSTEAPLHRSAVFLWDCLALQPLNPMAPTWGVLQSLAGKGRKGSRVGIFYCSKLGKLSLSHHSFDSVEYLQSVMPFSSRIFSPFRIEYRRFEMGLVC
jgi:hypothetical protein